MTTMPRALATNEDASQTPVKTGETAQTEVWKGEFGREYTDRNTLEIEGLEALVRQAERDYVACWERDSSSAKLVDSDDPDEHERT